MKGTQLPRTGKMPNCLLRKAEHAYEDGVCVNCGEDLLATTGWGRLRITTCHVCGSYISALARFCPEKTCQAPLKKTLLMRVNTFYLIYIEPFRIFLLCPRPCGANILEQVILILTTTLGIMLSGYIRNSATSSSQPIEAKELISSLVISLIIVPSIFKEAELLNPNTPFLSRIGLSLQKGVFSDAIIQGIGNELNG